MSIKQDQATSSASEGAETVSVTVSLESAESATPRVWKVTFLSHLEVSLQRQLDNLGLRYKQSGSTLGFGGEASFQISLLPPSVPVGTTTVDRPRSPMPTKY